MAPHRILLQLFGVMTVVLPLLGSAGSLLLAARLICGRIWGLPTRRWTPRRAWPGQHFGEIRSSSASLWISQRRRRV